MSPSDSSRAGTPIAVIGMAGRFPKAAGIEQLWENLCAGRECLTRFDEKELLEAGVAPALLADPDYVPVNGALEGADLFAANFFGYTPREALIMDPQQRHFLECSWEVLERAGYAEPPSSTGVFAGVSVSTYLLNRLIYRSDLLEGFADIETSLGTDKDFLATRVAYKLNLMGPAITVQSACSSSLVAVHLACRALEAGDCELALAGGASIDVPQRAGYLYRKEGIYSSDGHCRPFDARADGMIGGSGAGVVVLKPLDRALRDRDSVHAVILGSAINNDGANKVGYSAPSVVAQAEVITRAHSNAGVDPESLQYVEAHGTGTALGDPIEVAALTQAFDTPKRGFCVLGAVKSNLGHLNAAAGITGFIKAVLAVKHASIPPTIHFDRPNPHLDLDKSPFFINREPIDWPRETMHRRRAGISSFGMGGTNAHLVIEQAPEQPERSPSERPQLLVLSARSEQSLRRMRTRLADAMSEPEAPMLDDIAFTLQTGRRRFAERAAIVCDSRAQGAERLTSDASILTGTASDDGSGAAFLLPGQGAQHPGMARDLYQHRSVFRREVDRCSETLEPLIRADLRELILADPDDEEAAERLRQTEITQCALFTVEYALSVLWRTVGVQPVALIGHSIGEYTAACIAGVFGLEDALALVAERGRLLQALPPGSMLAAALGEAEIKPYLNPEIGVAAINELGTTVVSGPTEAIDDLATRLEAEGHASQRLRTSHAFHSPMMRPAARSLRDFIGGMTLDAPTIPFVSNVSGTWITSEKATDPDYWADHLLKPVRFMDGLTTVVDRGASVLLEVGPGTTLSTLARRHPGREVRGIVPTLPHPKQRRSADESFLEAIGRLWTLGVDLRWERVTPRSVAQRVALPTYPFERQRFWIDANPAGESAPIGAAPSSERQPSNQWCYLPSWHRTSLPEAPETPRRPVLVFDDGDLAVGLSESWGPDVRVVTVRSGSQFGMLGKDRFTMDPAETTHYQRLLEEIRPAEGLIVIHRWSDGETLYDGFDSLMLAAGVLGPRVPEVDWLALTDSAQDVVGNEELDPAQALALGPVRVIPFEYDGHRARNIDLSGCSPSQIVDAVRRELTFSSDESLVAYRGSHRWLPSRSPMVLPPLSATGPGLSSGTRCLVTGGTRGVGAALARALAERGPAKLALLGRSELPPRERWEDLLAEPSGDPGLTRTVETILEIEALGSEVLCLSADVADRESLAAALAAAQEAFGGLDLIVHAAGLPGGGAIELKTVEDARRTMAAKVEGTRLLSELTADAPPEMMVLCSSLASEIGGYGQVDYCAANAYQDAFASASQGRGRVLAIDWDTWSETGMAVDTEVPAELAADREEGLRLGLRTREGQDLFLRLLATSEARVMISTTSIHSRLDAYRRSQNGDAATPEAEPATDLASPRPELSTDYHGPREGTEREIAEIWRRLFGLEQVGRHDDFFELGGHSLLATQLLNRLRKARPTLALSMADLFERPTISQLAAAIEEQPTTEPTELPTADELRTRSAEERLDWLRGWIQERLPEEIEPSAELDVEALAPQLVWELRRDLSLSVYPHELRGARSVEEVALAIAAILEGAPPETSARTEAPATRASYPASEAPKNPPMIFLLSAPRSGSTLMRLMLAGHENLFCPPELALLSALDMPEWQAQQHGIFARDGLTRALMELRGISEAEALEVVAQQVAAGLPVQEVYRDLQTELGSRRLVDKSPAYALDPPTLGRIETLFEEPRYLLLTRHPIAVIDSLVRHRMEALLSADRVESPWRFAESIWRRANENLVELERDLAERCLRVRYEDLVREPEGTMRRIAGFLAIDYNPALIEPYGGGRMIDGPGDPDIFQHDAIDARLADTWRSVRVEEPLDQRSRELASQLGYTLPPETPVPRPHAATPSKADQAADTGSPRASRTGEPGVRAGGDPDGNGDRSVPIDAPADASALLDRLDDLSDDEVAATLSALLADEPDA